MMTVEDLQSSLTAASQRLSEAESNWAAQKQTLQDEQHRLKVELKALKAEREESAKTIPEEFLTMYQTLRATKQGHAVAILNGEMCSYCRVSQTTTMVQRILRDQELLTCSSCGRILVAL
jgi:predicted  nucleic acid-binding Zn-ribbon protein